MGVQTKGYWNNFDNFVSYRSNRYVYTQEEAVQPTFLEGEITQIYTENHTYARGSSISIRVSYQVQPETTQEMSVFFSGKIQTLEQYDTEESIRTLPTRQVLFHENFSGNLTWGWDQKNDNNEQVETGKYYVKISLIQRFENAA